MTREDVVVFQNQFKDIRQRMSQLIKEGVTKEAAGEQIKTDTLSWTMEAGRVIYAT